MKKSFTYYITMFVIKLKGIKNNFSQSPIDFKKIRKEDVPKPKGTFFKQNTIRTFKVLDSSITEIGLNNDSSKLIILIHGGAFVSGPAKHHWDAVKIIAKNTKHKIWVCNYPKAPETKIVEISANADAIYQLALKQYESSNISILGDSVGGLLSIALVQRLVRQNILLPKRLILISPVMDASMSNPEIEKMENRDPILSKVGVISAKKMCSGDLDLKNELISPLYGSFNHFPETFLFIAQNDIMYPDEILAIEKLRNSNIKTHVYEGKGMPHIWPLLPVMKEAKTSLNKIIQIIND